MAGLIRDRRQPANSYPRAALRYAIAGPQPGVVTGSRPWSKWDTMGLLLLVLFFAWLHGDS
ncbi:MAG: hypothetical protein ACYTGX_08815 [Planctomycetota bacterium]|jgi:hypothetical protein